MSFLPQPVTLQSLFGTDRMIGGITVQCVINEETNDTLTITKQPVQIGASIADHAFMEPTLLSMTILQQNSSSLGDILSNPLGAASQAVGSLLDTFSGGGLGEIYYEFRKLQADRSPFTITTPKRVYKSMLMSILRMNTDKNTENILSLSCSFQQVILVSVGTTMVPASQQKNAAKTQGTQNIGKQSALYSATQGIGFKLP
jgi:hypothetical protein